MELDEFIDNLHYKDALALHSKQKKEMALLSYFLDESPPHQAACLQRRTRPFSTLWREQPGLTWCQEFFVA
jgi:hypothetical protein